MALRTFEIVVTFSVKAETKAEAEKLLFEQFPYLENPANRRRIIDIDVRTVEAPGDKGFNLPRA